MVDLGKPVKGEDWRDPIAGLDFVWVEGLGVWVSKYQATNAQYRLHVNEHDSGSFRGQTLNDPRQPVSSVSYEDSQAWCDWLTAQLQERELIEPRLLVRMPSDQEWSAYAKCGDGRVFPWGNEMPPTRGNYACETAHEQFPDWDYIVGYRSGHAVACNVEDSGRNEWGLYGVGGNCYEWTFEADGMSVQLCGGSWSTCQEPYLRIDNRYRREPRSRLLNFSFRPILA